MVVKDTVRQQRDEQAAIIDAYADRVNSWTKETLSRGVVAPSDQLLNPEHQRGHIMMPAQLERILAAMGPNLLTDVHPRCPQRKCIWFVKPDGSREFISAYENGPMPEYSIFTARYEWVPDTDYLGSTSDNPRVIERADMRGGSTPVSLQAAHDLLQTKGHDGALAELKKRQANEVDPDVRPGMKKVLKLGAEGIRGWRTHLVYVVQHGVATLGDVERALAAEKLPANVDNASWARQTGAQAAAVAW